MVLKTASTGGLAQIASIVAQLLIIRLSIDYVGPNKFGVWMAVNSFIAFLVISDFGLGGALLRISARTKQLHGGYDVFATAVLSIRFLAVIGFFVLLSIYFLTNHQAIQANIGIDQHVSADLVITTVRVLVALFVVNMIAQISVPLRLGMQKGHLNGLFQTCGHLGNLGLVLIAIQLEAPLPALAAAAIGGTIIANLINLLALLSQTKGLQTHKSEAPKIGQILRPSLPYFCLSVIGALSYNIDNLVIANYLPIEQVAQNAVAQRVFNAPINFISLFYLGLWAAYADAELSNEYKWIKKTYFKAIAFAVPFSLLLALILYASFDVVQAILTNGKIDFDVYLLISYACLLPVVTWSGATASLMNGLHLLKQQMAVSLFAMIINIALSVYLVNVVGVSGPVIATLISMLLTQPIMMWICLTELRHRQRPGLSVTDGTQAS
jgi:O-antigen/teichoic acid export membrane protein